MSYYKKSASVKKRNLIDMHLSVKTQYLIHLHMYKGKSPIKTIQ